MRLSDRLSRLEQLARDPRIARDLEVIRLQLARAEGKLAQRAGNALARVIGRPAGN